MITLLTRKIGSNKKTKASKVEPINSTDTQKKEEKQVIQPDFDSAAHRRANELSTKNQEEFVVEEYSEKVKRLKAEIEHGTYKVDADAIAEKLMQGEFKVVDKPVR